MPRFICPRCKDRSISLLDKYRLGLWLTTRCPKCGTRLCANPYLLFVLYFLYVWNFMWWPTLAYYTGNYWHLIYLLPCWLVIDLINLRFIPMSCMKKKVEAPPGAG